MIKRFLNKLSFSLMSSIMFFIEILLIFFIVGGMTYLAILLGFIDQRSHVELLVIVLIVCFIVGVITVFIISPKLMKPFQRIIDSIEKLSEGDFSVRIPSSRRRPINIFSESFNRMAEELGSIEVLRNDFINNFSHEFKTPIVSKKGFAEMR